VQLLSFTATADNKSIKLSWETASETDNLGFNLYRATAIDGQRTKLNKELIPSATPPGTNFGAVYEYVDTAIKSKKATYYYYWLEAMDIYGSTQLFGPEEAQLR
jgi:hypothetical protein